jgi:Zn-dependent peptidase ImmA (M78 family)
VVDRVTSFLKDKAQVLTVPPSEDLAVIGSCDAAMMFGAVSPSLTENDILLLADILAHSYSEGGEPAALQRYANISPYESAGEPWIAGYELADEFLDKLDADKVDYAPQGWVDVERIANILDVGIRDVELADHELRGASFAGKDHVPQVLLNRSHATSSYPSGRRFSVAHELAHVLHDRLYANRLAIISGPWAPPAIEKRANAFAAMLLMPKRLLDRHRAQFANLSPESISKLADILAVSHTALIHHLKNIGRLDEGTAEAFLASVCTR